MVNHLKNKHRNTYLEFLQKSALGKGKITNFVSMEKKLVHPKFDEERFKEILLKFIITTDQPFSVIEDESFQELIKYSMQDINEVKLPGRAAIRRMISETYQSKFKELKATLIDAPGKLSFSVDGWSSRNGYAFQGVIAHWISEEWELKSIVIDLSIVDGSHSGANLAQNFWDVLTRYGINDKLLGLTADNAFNMNTFANKLEAMVGSQGIFTAKDHRVRCMAHIVNLACQQIITAISANAENLDESGSESDGDISEDDENEPLAISSLTFIDKIRKSCVGILSSPQRRQQLKRQCEVAGVKPTSLRYDVPTRWNSTLDMLERALELRRPFQLTVQSCRNLAKFNLTSAEWIKVEKTINLLRPFKDATKLLSEDGVPKLSETQSIYNALFDHLEAFVTPKSTKYKESRQKSTSAVEDWLQKAADAGWKKLTEYFPTTDGMIYSVATSKISAPWSILLYCQHAIILIRYMHRGQCYFIAITR